MEQVTFTAQPTGLYILDGQTVFIQNEVGNSNISSVGNVDIVQQALDGLNATIPSTTNNSGINLNQNENNIGQNYVLLDRDESEDERVVQLSISDDFPLQFLSSSPKKEVGCETPESSLLKNIFSSGDEKCDSSSSTDLLSNLLKIPPSDNVGNHYELVSPLKGNFTYAYKLSDGSKLCPISQIENSTTNVCSSAVSVNSNGTSTNSVSVSCNRTISNGLPLKNNRKVVYVNKFLNGVGLKPRILMNMKPKVPQEEKKRVPKKIQVIPSKGKSILLNASRTIASQKVVPLTINSVKEKEIVNSPKFVMHRDLKTKNTASPTVLNNSLLQTKIMDHIETVDSRSECSVVQTGAKFQQTLLKKQLQQQKPAQVITSSSLLNEDQSHNEANSVGRLTESQLKKIAAVFQNSCLNHTRLTNSTIFDSETNTRIVCRIVYPEDLIKNSEKQVIKRGKKRSRPVEVTKKPPPEDEKAKKPPPPSARTRSGRLSRPPRYMVKDFKKLTEDSEASYSDYRSDSEENSENSPFLHLPHSKQRKISTKFHCPTCGKVYLGKRRMWKHFSEYPDHKGSSTIFEWENENQENAKQQEKERNLWKRIFRRGSRKPRLDSAALLKELFHACSNEHFIPVAKERIAAHVEPWDYLRTRHLREGAGVKSLLTDLSTLIRSIPNNLLQAAQPEDTGSIHIEDEKLCQLLNISPGHYLPNESALKGDEEIKDTCDDNNTTFDKDIHCEQPPSDCWALRNNICSDDSIKMELESDKIDTVDDVSKESSLLGEILLEKSTLESVDQIVSERLNDLIPTNPLDVNSLVEAQVLARSLLNSPPDLLHNVSGSTEDLLKTLENLTPDLPSDSASADFDFVLSSDFTSDR